MTSVTLTLSEEQLARLRAVLFRELREVTDMLTEQAGGAAQHNAADGIDALATLRLSVAPVAELLDLIGWDTRNGLSLELRDDQRRRVDELDHSSA